MIHKKAYRRGLIKVALQQAPQQYARQVDPRSRSPRAHQAVSAGGSNLTYKDIGFNNQGVYDVNYNTYDKAKASGQAVKPTFMQFISDEKLSGKYYIPRKNLKGAQAAMARYRGGNTQLGDREVSKTDFGKYLRTAYTSHRNQGYQSDSGYLNDALSAYQEYLRTGTKPAAYTAAAPAARQSPGADAPDPKDTEPLVKPGKADGDGSNVQGTSGNQKVQKPVQAQAQPALGFTLNEAQAKMLQQYYRPFFSAHRLLKQNPNVYYAYKNGAQYTVGPRSSVGGYAPGKPVADLFHDAGYTGDGSHAGWSRQRQYNAHFDSLATMLGKNKQWMWANMDKLFDLYNRPGGFTAGTY